MLSPQEPILLYLLQEKGGERAGEKEGEGRHTDAARHLHFARNNTLRVNKALIQYIKRSTPDMDV